MTRKDRLLIMLKKQKINNRDVRFFPYCFM